MKRKSLQNLTDILESKKLFKKISEQSDHLKKFLIVWESALKKTNLNPQLRTFFEHSQPLTIQHKTLHIGCENSLVSNHARYIHQEIIHLLREFNVNDITALDIRILTDFIQVYGRNKQQIDRDFDADSITALKRFSASCRSGQLKLSTERLIKTIEKGLAENQHKK